MGHGAEPDPDSATPTHHRPSKPFHKFGRCEEDLGASFQCRDGRWTGTSNYCWKHYLPREVEALRTQKAALLEALKDIASAARLGAEGRYDQGILQTAMADIWRDADIAIEAAS